MPAESTSMINNIVNRVNDNTKRIRHVEENIRNLTELLKNFQDEFLRLKKDIIDDSAKAANSMKELRDRQANHDVDITKITKEIKDLITRRELRELQGYIDLINPITTKFVTKKELEEIVEEKVDQALKKSHHVL